MELQLQSTLKACAWVVLQIFPTERAVRIDTDAMPDDGIPDFLVNDELDNLRIPESIHSSESGDVLEINFALDNCLASDLSSECANAIVDDPVSSGSTTLVNVRGAFQCCPMGYPDLGLSLW